MEVGAVKQAFNNEVIRLKKPLNQARIQIIHKLTRKAKTFVDKKGPENLKVKLKRKAESAVKEVMIIKKIKPKDLAKFIVTHEGDLQKHLNKPDVDEDKACARLLLHKSLQDKYSFFRERYSNIPIKDLFMSRLERKKIKKEEKDMQKNKKKEKEARKRNNSTGDWKVEDVDNAMETKGSNMANKKSKIDTKDEKNQSSDDENHEEITDEDDDFDNEQDSNDETSDSSKMEATEIPDDDVSQDLDENVVSDNDDLSDDKKSNNMTDIFVKTPTKDNKNSVKIKQKPALTKPVKEDNRKKIPKQHKETNKNKKLPEKFISKKSDIIETPVANKVVDPFFVTSTGENYMSLAEPRAPDEVKEIHKQGNRKIRRAALFGHEPKHKTRSKFSNNNNKFNKFNNSQGFSNNFDKNVSDSSDNFNKQKRFNRDVSVDNNVGNKSFNKFNNDKDAKKAEAKPEKLHPSWEAKKKLSSVLPFQGKKIVFNDS